MFRIPTQLGSSNIMTVFFRAADPVAQSANHLVNNGFQMLHSLADQAINYLRPVVIQISENGSLNHAALIASNLGIFLLADHLTNKLSLYCQKHFDLPSNKKNSFKKIIFDNITFGSIIALLNHSLSLAFQYPLGKVTLGAIIISHISFRYLLNRDTTNDAWREIIAKELDLLRESRRPPLCTEFTETQAIDDQIAPIPFLDTEPVDKKSLEHLTKLKETIKKFTEHQEKLINKIEEQEHYLAETKSLKKQLIDSFKELEILKSVNKTKESEILEFENEFFRLNKEIDQLKQDAKSNEIRLTESLETSKFLQRQVDIANEDAERLKHELSATEKKTLEVETENQKLQLSLKALQSKKQAIESELRNTRQHCRRLELSVPKVDINEPGIHPPKAKDLKGPLKKNTHKTPSVDKENSSDNYIS